MQTLVKWLTTERVKVTVDDGVVGSPPVQVMHS